MTRIRKIDFFKIYLSFPFFSYRLQTIPCANDFDLFFCNFTSNCINDFNETISNFRETSNVSGELTTEIYDVELSVAGT